MEVKRKHSFLKEYLKVSTLLENHTEKKSSANLIKFLDNVSELLVTASNAEIMAAHTNILPINCNKQQLTA